LQTHHLKAPIKYVDQVGVLETHADVPGSVREQVYAEENQRLDKKKETCGERYNRFNVPSNQYHCPPGRIISAVDTPSC
jgi:hypothetical protein